MFANCVILHVDDDDNDSLFFQRALAKNGFAGTYRRVRSGKDARDYLIREVPFADRLLFPTPNLIVTDMGLIDDGGVELIRWIRDQATYRKTTIIVLSGTVDGTKQQSALDAGATRFLSKGISYTDTIERIQAILQHCPPASTELPGDKGVGPDPSSF
jgi:DNA-binding response OmpR family regulator